MSDLVGPGRTFWVGPGRTGLGVRDSSNCTEPLTAPDSAALTILQ